MCSNFIRNFHLINFCLLSDLLFSRLDLWLRNQGASKPSKSLRDHTRSRPHQPLVDWIFLTCLLPLPQGTSTHVRFDPGLPCWWGSYSMGCVSGTTIHTWPGPHQPLVDWNFLACLLPLPQGTTTHVRFDLGSPC